MHGRGDRREWLAKGVVSCERAESRVLPLPPHRSAAFRILSSIRPSTRSCLLAVNRVSAVKSFLRARTFYLKRGE